MKGLWRIGCTIALSVICIAACARADTPDTTAVATRPATAAVTVTQHVATPSALPTAKSTSPTTTVAAVETLTPTPKPNDLVCITPQSDWVQVNELLGFQLHDGRVGEGDCELILVGEQVGTSERGVVLHLANGGKTITMLTEIAEALHIWHIAVLGDQIWIAGDSKDGTQLLFISRDNGVSWSDIPLPAQTSTIRALSVSNDSLWLAIDDGSDAVLLTTADDGVTWRELITISSVGGRLALFEDLVVNGDIVGAVGTNGMSAFAILSQDQGTTFQQVAQITEMSVANSISIPDAGHVYIAGYRTTTGRLQDASATLWVTGDGAQTWQMVDGITTPYIPDIAFTSGEQGYAVASMGADIVILETTDAFQSFQAIRLEPQPVFGLEALLTGSDGSIYAIGSGGSGIYLSKP